MARWIHDKIETLSGEHRENVQVFLGPLTGQPEPDASIRAVGAPAKGAFIFGKAYPNQTVTSTVPAPLTPRVYLLTFTYDGVGSDFFTIKGTKGGAAWSVAYYNRETEKYITKAVTGEGWQTKLLRARFTLKGQILPLPSQTIEVIVTPLAKSALDPTKAIVVTATSKGDPTRSDSVGAITTLSTGAAAAGALAVSAASAQQTAAGATLTYTLSAPAEVQATVLNMAGRVIAEIPAGPQEAGVQTLRWNGRNSSGSLAPGGAYLLRITARSADGAAAQAVTVLNLRR